ncbi:MAG: GSCFA domain-containing protein [Desulfobacterales bacterium]|nr:MAG: GSCFA domain-containing protein [Desulfobacterales bacterium]
MNQQQQFQLEKEAIYDDWRMAPVVPGNVHDIAPHYIKIPYRPIIEGFDTFFVSFGSCFAAHAVNSLKEMGFNTYYNRLNCFHYTSRSLLAFLKTVEEGREYTEEDLYWLPGSCEALSLYHNMLYETGPGAKEKLITKMRSLQAELKAHLAQADVILLTLGNATYLWHKKLAKTICYGKGIPAAEYAIRLSTPAEIARELKGIYRILTRICAKDFYLVVTISPQRYAWDIDEVVNGMEGESGGPNPPSSHPADGVLRSNLDKAKLRVAIDQFLTEHRSARLEYFPAYDIVRDELRANETYRFNFADHRHVMLPHTPNYVLNRFLQSRAHKTLIEVLQLNRRLIHYLFQCLELQQHGNSVSLEEFWIELKKLNENRSLAPIMKNVARILESRGIPAQGVDGIAPSAGTSEPRKKRPSQTFYKNCVQKALIEFDKYARELVEKRTPVIVYGVGEHTDFLFRHTLLSKLNILAFADRKYKTQKNVFGREVIAPHRIEAYQPEVVIISSLCSQIEIKVYLETLQCGVKIKTIYPEDQIGLMIEGYKQLR